MTIIATPIQVRTDTSEYFVSCSEAMDQLVLSAVTPRLQRCVASVNDRLVRLTGYVPYGSVVSEDLDGGSLYLFLTYRPIIGLTSIYDLTASVTFDAAEYEQRGAERDRVYLLGASYRWPCGQQRYRVSYVAGTGTPPAVLRSIALAMVDREYNVGQEGARPPMTTAEIDDLLRDFYRIG